MPSIEWFRASPTRSNDLLVVKLLVDHLEAVHALLKLGLGFEGLLRAARFRFHVKNSLILFSDLKAGGLGRVRELFEGLTLILLVRIHCYKRGALVFGTW